MKKTRKLNLDRESIRPLIQTDLKQIAGGGSIFLPCVTQGVYCVSNGHQCTQ
jgi:natural product precursor